MRKLLKNKITGRHGFSLAETMLATLILLLVSIIVATGVPAARNAYEKVVLASNAEVLLSTTISALRNELGTASDVSVSGTEITYYNAARGARSKIYKNTDAADKDAIYIQRYMGDSGLGNTGNEGLRLVSKEASTGDLYVTYNSVTSLTDGVITFKDLQVKRKSGVTLTERETLSIRVIAG